MKLLLTTGTPPQPPVSVTEIAGNIAPDAKVVGRARKARLGEAKQIPIANSPRGGMDSSTNGGAQSYLTKKLRCFCHKSGNLPLVEQAEANIMLALPA
jgi:hypothetical protein